MDDETWIRGPIPPIADSDGIHKTFDIKYVNLGSMGVHWAWPETHDHAKWGITLHEPWVCVGDINRMISQRKRGGGTIAFQNTTLWLGLSKAGLVLAPPGHSRAEAHDLIKKTQHPNWEAPPKVKPSASRPLSKKLKLSLGNPNMRRLAQQGIQLGNYFGVMHPSHWIIGVTTRENPESHHRPRLPR